jgi:diaminopimelate epimerase
MTPFYKFHGTGNDFILLDGFNNKVVTTPATIKEACDRHLGIGADGFIIITPSEEADFRMLYYNSDGSRATMCGNGARCAVALCKMLEIASSDIAFMADDGFHIASAQLISEGVWDVEVKMNDTEHPVKTDGVWYINTGTPHIVKLVDNVQVVEPTIEGPTLRNDIRFQPNGVNVNWVAMTPGNILVRTYEKGVENETLSCGTGVTASAIVGGMLTNERKWKVETKGGTLQVSFDIQPDSFKNIRLRGPAKLVFTGETTLF